MRRESGTTRRLGGEDSETEEKAAKAERRR